MPACDNITDSKIQFQLKGPFLVSQAFSLIIIKHETYIEFDSPSLQGNIYMYIHIRNPQKYKKNYKHHLC